MAAPKVAIGKRHFDGHGELVDERRRVDQAGSKSLPQILRNFVDELAERIQSGVGSIANAAAEATIALAPAMPDTNYDVFVQMRETGTAKLVGPVDIKHMIVLDADKAVGSFKVKMDPGAINTLEIVDFYWFAHSRTRINTKA